MYRSSLMTGDAHTSLSPVPVLSKAFLFGSWVHSFSSEERKKGSVAPDAGTDLAKAAPVRRSRPERKRAFGTPFVATRGPKAHEQGIYALALPVMAAQAFFPGTGPPFRHRGDALVLGGNHKFQQGRPLTFEEPGEGPVVDRPQVGGEVGPVSYTHLPRGAPPRPTGDEGRSIPVLRIPAPWTLPECTAHH